MTAGRPIEFDPEQALDAAMRLFWRKGYEATSLQDLLEVMDISKSSFYQAFKSKHALFQRCIERYREELSQQMRRELAATRSGRAFISAKLHGIAEETCGPDARIGCLMMNTASEFAQRDPMIAKLINHGVLTFTNIFEEAVKKGQAHNDIPKDKDARALASYLVTNMGGLRNMVKAGADAETVNRVADLTLAVLD